MVQMQYPVVIIGSGIGGATTAYALARRGIEVLIVERGDYLPVEPENWSEHAIFIDKRYKPKETWLDDKEKEFVPGVHYFVGGNSKVYGAALPRFRTSDFEYQKHLEGDSPAWPFRYSDLEPYYSEAEVLYKVHGTAGIDLTDPPRSKDYPFPSLPHEPYVQKLDYQLKTIGLHPFPNSMGIDLGPSGKCVRCSTCDGFVCKVGAKSDAQSCALDAALKTGLVKILTNTQVEKLVSKDGGKSINHLIANQGDKTVEIKGGKFVLSAGAVNSAALLLKSGIANSSDQIGRNFMMHINTHVAAFDPARKNNLIFQKTLSFNDWYLDGGNGYPLGAVQLIGKVTGLMMKSYATKVPRILLNYIADHSVEFVLMTEDLPDSHNRVTISPAGKIQISRNAIGRKSHRELLKKSEKALRKIGYKAFFKQPFDISMNSHQCGTVKAGEDPKTSVLDRHCKSHDVNNLWVIDGGFFPSSAAMNPALTIAAQALHSVDRSDLGRN
jgi:choline dehydrogenase-like flavoprotein